MKFLFMLLLELASVLMLAAILMVINHVGGFPFIICTSVGVILLIMCEYLHTKIKEDNEHKN